MTNLIQNFFELKQEKGFKIVHLNIRSLFKKIDQLRSILEASDIDVFTLSETWLNPKIDTKLIQINGYIAYRLDRETNGITKKRGGGLLTYIKKSYDVYVQDSENISVKDLEIQWFKIRRHRMKTITLANFYRPPAGKVNQAFKTLDKDLTTLVHVNEEIVLLGDFNIDYKNKKSQNFKKLNFFERANALEQKICTTTRNTKSSSSILDIILTNMKYIKSAGTLDTFLSDHQPIFLLKKKEKNKGKLEQTFQGRSYRTYDKQKFVDNILAQRWNYFYDAPDPSQAWEEMSRIITREADKQCPLRTYKIRHKKPCWLTNEILEIMKDRDYFYQKAKRTNSEDDWNIAKFHRNQTNFNVRKAKADYIKDQLRNSEGNSSKFWRTIKQIMPSKKGQNSEPQISIMDDNNEAIKDYATADFMNEYFASLGSMPKKTCNDSRTPKKQSPTPPTPKNQSLDSPTVPPHKCPSEEETEKPFEFVSVSRVEVDRLLRKINISKSSGITFLSSKLFKDSFQALSDRLTYLFNFSLERALFPDQWKKALVIPIPKTGDPKKAENYRPISLLPLPGKILEKLAHTQLAIYLENNNMLSDNQFGFRRQRSTSHAISQLLNQIYTNINRSTITAAIYIDFSKAFNCVQHTTLISKLSEFNIGPDTISWISSYLQGRVQRSLVNNKYSSVLPVTQGVPQGSVLGPLLYIVYSNDIASKINNSSFTFYADDTVLYSKKKLIGQAGTDLQKDLTSLSEWCTENQIFINPQKTKAMFFGSKAKINSVELPVFNINDTVIDRTKSYTYLGIKLDEQLTLETHATALITRVSNRIYQLTKIRPFITKKAALMIYKNMILPILEYGDVFIHSAPQKVRKKLQTLQNKALKCALQKDKYYNSIDLHTEAKLLKLKNRRHIHILLHMFQLAQMPGFKLWKTHQPVGVRTRSSKKKLLFSRYPKNKKYKKSITYQGPKLWNNLPAWLQKIETYADFKVQLIKHFQVNNKNLTPTLKPKPKPKSKQTKQPSSKSITKNKAKTRKPRTPIFQPTDPKLQNS